MRRIIILVLLAASVFSLSACSGNRYLRGQATANAQLEKDLKAIEDTRKALAALGADVGDMDDLFIASMMIQPESPDEPDNARDYSDYTEMPIDILSIEKPGENKFSGNRYYFNGYVMGSGGLDDEVGYFDIYVNLEDNEHYKSMAIAGTGAEEGFSDIELGDEITVYFQYLGYSDEIRQHIGHFEYCEDYRPF